MRGVNPNIQFPPRQVGHQSSNIEFDPIRSRLLVTRWFGTLLSIIGMGTAQLAAHLGVYDVPNIRYYELFGIVSLIWLVLFWWVPWPRGRVHAPAVMSITCLGLVFGTVALTGAGDSLAWIYAMPLAFFNGLYFRRSIALLLLPLLMATGMIPAAATQNWAAFQDQVFIVAPVFIIATMMGIAVVPELRTTAVARLQSELAHQRALDAEGWTKRLESVQDVAWQAHQSTSVEQIYSALISQIQRAIDYDSCIVHLHRDGHLDAVVNDAVNEQDTERGKAQHRLEIGEGLPGWVAREGQPVLLDNIAGDQRSLRLPLHPDHHESALSVPLNGHGQVVGVITLYKAGRAQFSQDDRRAMIILGDHAGTAISNAQLLETARRDAETDGMTGLLNQSASRLRLGSLLGDRLDEQQLSVILLDLNDFKAINDALGHLAGDKMLCRLADILSATCRKGDIVSRNGGDEFMLILPNAARADAEAIGNIIVRTASTEGADLGVANPIPISLSFGSATAPDDGQTVTELLEAADARLYQQKRERDAVWKLDASDEMSSIAVGAE